MKKLPLVTNTSNTESSGGISWYNFSYTVLPLTILVVVTIASFLFYGLATASLNASRARTVERTILSNQRRITNSLDEYARMQLGNVGWVQSGQFNEGEWLRFISVYNLPVNYAGVEAVGISYGSSVDNNAIAYVRPETDRTSKTIGYNMGLNPALSDTMARAAKSGQTTLTETLPDVFSTKSDVHSLKNGFLMYTPIYRQSLPVATPDQRLQALRGYVVAMFRGEIFFASVFNDADLSHTRVQVYIGDVDSKNILYDAGQNTEKDVRRVTKEITQYGQKIIVVYTLDTAYISVWLLTYFPQIILFGGLFLGLIFAVASGYMLRNRYRRLMYEKERDVEFAKDELLSLASHQLRTPATGVKQYLGMVLQGFAGDISEKQREYLDRAYASNNRQLNVINDILHLAKLDTGRIVLAETKFDLAKMVRDVVDEQSDTARAGGIKLMLESPSRGMVLGDSHMLRMVIENLLSNAIKYTPDGGSVTVRMSRRSNQWVIAVKDTGVGIAKSDFHKLFKQFTRIDNPRAEFVTGTGVGLYLAYHLMILHGGDITVTSRKGKGSTFTARIPRKI